MKNLFIGIDFSKKKFDVSMFERSKPSEIKYEVFENTRDGFQSLLSWVSSSTSPVQNGSFVANIPDFTVYL